MTLVMPGLVATEFAKNVVGEPSAGPAPGSRPLPAGVSPQTADEVAAVIAGVIERPVAEVFTNPASADLVRAYYADVAAFERSRE